MNRDPLQCDICGKFLTYYDDGICASCSEHAQFDDDDFCPECGEFHEECSCTDYSLGGDAIYSMEV